MTSLALITPDKLGYYFIGSEDTLKKTLVTRSDFQPPSAFPLNFVDFKCTRDKLAARCHLKSRTNARQGKAYSLQRRKVTVNSPECNRVKLPLVALSKKTFFRVKLSRLTINAIPRYVSIRP